MSSSPPHAGSTRSSNRQSPQWLPRCEANVVALRWTSPVTSAYMLEASAHAAFSGNSKYHTDYEWVDLEHISPNAAIAVVASEDQQFPFHAGLTSTPKARA